MTSEDREGVEGLARRVRDGDRRALSRAISWIEDKSPRGRTLLDALYLPVPRAHRIGVTGPPGSGKSTLVNCLTRALRARGKMVGVIAVDPTSPFTGGAILGDRIRMQEHHADTGVFIRSMASRGSLGGLASTTYEASEAMEAAGCDWILIETVGVGQSELEVVEAADTVVVVLVPESGDAVQVMKAGIMEAADIFAVNKFDREGGDRLEREIMVMLELASGQEAGRSRSEGMGPWRRRICRTVATSGEGMDDLLGRIEEHWSFLRGDEAAWEAHRLKRVERRLKTQLRDRLLHALLDSGEWDVWLEESGRKVLSGESSPYAIVDEMVSVLIGNGAGGSRIRPGQGETR